MPNEEWDFHVTGHSLFPLHVSTEHQTGAGKVVSQPKKLVFLLLCLGRTDFRRRWERWGEFFWHLKYFLSRIGTQTLPHRGHYHLLFSGLYHAWARAEEWAERGTPLFLCKIGIELAHWFISYCIWIGTDTGIHTLIAQCSFFSGTLIENVQGGTGNK